MKAWQGFKEGRWTKEIDVRGFIQANYTPYEGDDSFLAGATENTKQLWEEVMELFKKERENGSLSARHGAAQLNHRSLSF